MDCHDATTRFSELRDGQLSGEELAGLERHITICPTCRQEWAHFQEVVEALHGLRPVEPSHGFAGRVRAQIEAPPWYRRLARRLFVPWQIKLPIEVAALAILAVGTVLIYQRSPEMRQVVEQPKVPEPPARIEVDRRDAMQMKKPAFRALEKEKRQPQIAPLARELPESRADEAAPQAKVGIDDSAGAAVSKQSPSRDLNVVLPAPPEIRMEAYPREAGQPSRLPSEREAQPAAPHEVQESVRPLATQAPVQAALHPFRIMTLRTHDVAAAEQRIRRWIGLVGGRLLDPPVASAPTPSDPRSLSLVVPVRAVPRLDALLAELGQLFGKEFAVPPSDEVLISLSVLPKAPAPSADTE